MAATAQLLKLFSRKRKVVEEEMHSFQRVNDEEARRRFTEELDFETEVYANTFCILLLKDRWLYVSKCLIPASKFVCRCIYTHRRIIRPDGLSTLVHLPRLTKQIVRVDG